MKNIKDGEVTRLVFGIRKCDEYNNDIKHLEIEISNLKDKRRIAMQSLAEILHQDYEQQKDRIIDLAYITIGQKTANHFNIFELETE
jgi:hypothetical protein